MNIGDILRLRASLTERLRTGPDQVPATAPALESLVPGRWVQSPLGRCFVSERRYPLSHQHGDLPLGDLLTSSGAPWPELFFRGEPFDLSRAVLLDTETTGLGRGPGTFCFLVGLGQIEGDEMVVRQYLAPDYGDEPYLLELVSGAIEGSSGLISFNGASFDVPLLDARFILNGYARSPLTHRPHLDLLPVARRLWRGMLASCALVALEQDILHVPRSQDDVPGYLIPGIYQDYLTYGETEGLARVMLHNVVDVLSMVSLSARAARVLAEDSAREPSPYRDPVALGRLYEAQGQPEEALAAYRQGVVAGDSASRGEARQRLAMLLKRLGRWDEAVAEWHAALEGDALEPYVELAKYLEHQKRAWAEARALVQRAILGVREGRLRCRSRAEALGELRHRLNRLERRLAAQGRQSEDGAASGPMEATG